MLLLSLIRTLNYIVNVAENKGQSVKEKEHLQYFIINMVTLGSKV